MKYPFYENIAGKNRISIIAEIKKRSPSHGDFPSRDEESFVQMYEEGGASAISVVTDGPRFGGSLALLQRVASFTTLPVLRKDFLKTTDDLDRTKSAGAAAVLLITHDLDEKLLLQLTTHALGIGLTPLIEIHDSIDLKKALTVAHIPGIIFGINNRNLQTFDIDVGHTEKFLSHLPPHIPVIAESGFSTPEQLQYYSGLVDGALIGTALLTAKNPLVTLQTFTV